MQNEIINKPSLNYSIKAKKNKGDNIIDVLLASRGITNKEEFLNPLSIELLDPYYFQDMKKAVDIIKNAIYKKEKIANEYRKVLKTSRL